MLISHIDSLLIHLESLRLCLNMQRAFSPLPLARSRGDESPPLVRSRGGWDPASREIAWGWEPASREIAWGMRPCLPWDCVGMRACLSWDRVEMNPASREIEPRPIVFPAPFQARQLCSVEGISETARTQGGGFSGITSGIITHAPAAAMAGISSPVNGVDFGMFAHRGHIEALTQPRSLQPGEFPCAR